MPSLAGVPDPDAKVGGVDRPILEGIVAEIGSAIIFGLADMLDMGDGLNDGK